MHSSATVAKLMEFQEDNDDPISLYNQVISCYNHPINTQEGVLLNSMTPSAVFRLMYGLFYYNIATRYSLISTHLSQILTMLVMLLVPVANVVLYVLMVVAWL